MLDQRIKFTFV